MFKKIVITVMVCAFICMTLGVAAATKDLGSGGGVLRESPADLDIQKAPILLESDELLMCLHEFFQEFDASEQSWCLFGKLE